MKTFKIYIKNIPFIVLIGKNPNKRAGLTQDWHRTCKAWTVTPQNYKTKV